MKLRVFQGAKLVVLQFPFENLKFQILLLLEVYYFITTC